MKRSVLLLGLLMAGLTSGVMATEQPVFNSPVTTPTASSSTTWPSMDVKHPVYHVTLKINGQVKAEGEVRTELGKEARFDATKQSPYIASVSVTHTSVLPSNVDKNEKVSDESIYNEYAQKVLALNDAQKPGESQSTSFDPSVVTTGLIVALTPQAHDHVQINLNYSELLSIRTFTAEDGTSIELPDVFQQTNEQSLTLAPEHSMLYTLDVGHCKGKGGGTLTGEPVTSVDENHVVALYACHPGNGPQGFFAQTPEKRVTIEITRTDRRPTEETTSKATSKWMLNWELQNPQKTEEELRALAGQP